MTSRQVPQRVQMTRNTTTLGKICKQQNGFKPDKNEDFFIEISE